MQVLYFAWLRQKVGVGTEEVTPPADVVTVGDLIDWLKTRSDGHAAAFADGALIRCALDQDHATPDTPLGSAREVAFFPPVTGG